MMKSTRTQNRQGKKQEKKAFDRLILGENSIYSSDCSETGINNNILVCSTSGAGKTMSVIEPRLLETKNSSLVVTVTKRRIVNKYRPMFEQRGYTVFDLNFADPEKSDTTYDPLAYIRETSDISYLAKALVMSDPRKERSHADPFWDETACSLLAAEIAMVRYLNPAATFADVLDYHDRLIIEDGREGIRTSHDSDFESLRRRLPGHFAVTNWKTFRALPLKTAGCVFGTLNTMLDNIFTPRLRRMIASKDTVDFEMLAQTRCVLFLTSSAVNPSLNCFVNMFYGQMFKQLFEFGELQPEGRLPLPVSVLCDDFATGSCILNFPEYISIFREKGISVTLLIQSESQLSALYGPDNATTIINNCDTYLYLGGNDIATGKMISMRINLPLDEILCMPIGQEIIFRRGSHPVITQRYNILEDENYRTVTRQYEESLGAGGFRRDNRAAE